MVNMRMYIMLQIFNRVDSVDKVRQVRKGELTQRAKQRRGLVEALSEADRAVFAEMAKNDQFGNDAINVVRNDLFRYQEAMYPGHAQTGGPAWMQQMLGWQLGAPLPQTMMQPMPSIHPSMPPSMPPPLPPQMPVNPWAEPWPWNSNASSSSGHNEPRESPPQDPKA